MLSYFSVPKQPTPLLNWQHSMPLDFSFPSYKAHYAVPQHLKGLYLGKEKSCLLFLLFVAAYILFDSARSLFNLQIQNEGNYLQMGAKDALLNALLLAAKRFSLGPPQVILHSACTKFYER